VCDNLRTKQQYLENKETRLQQGREWYCRNKERKYSVAKIWNKENAGKKAAICGNRRARKMQATPTWLTPEQKKWIAWHYDQAAKMKELTGIPHHVDHVHPLQGKTFCGLHVPWNLQVIPAIENKRKWNKL